MNGPLSLVALTVGLSALAADPSYEERLIAWGLSSAGRIQEADPEGKQLEEILIASEEIFGERDPYPSELNLLHRLTRESVVRREILLKVGSPYQARLADETERNLRGRFIFAVARLVPVKGRSGGVALVVITKDRWSLRLNSDFNFVGALLQRLRLRPTEQNFLGLDQQLIIDFLLELDTLQLGQVFQDRRILGSQLSLGESAAVVLNRSTLAVEGATGKVVGGRPLYSIDDPWGLWVEGEWDLRTERVFRGAQVWQLEGPGGPVPYVYDSSEFKGQVLYTRSMGGALKLNLSGGLGAFARRFAAPAALHGSQRQFLEEGFLPRSESAVFWVAQLLAFERRYQALQNVEAFALSEDFHLGFRALLTARWAHPAFLSAARFLELGASVRYRLLAHADLATLTIAASARAQQGWVNRRLAAELSNFSPPLGPGRLVFRALIDWRWDDFDHRPFLLGGGNGLRGAPAEALAGRSLTLVNLEYRTRALEFHTVYLGGVLFWDGGASFPADAAGPIHTVGVGLRIMLPQFNQETIRLDFGMVLSGESPLSADRFGGSFGQVTDYRPSFLDRPLP